jgi:NAD(P)-dependent dehydrogenase (short-subunit alcohol dehydrogenase family)
MPQPLENLPDLSTKIFPRAEPSPDKLNIWDYFMNGKVCLITGATSGIGAITALELAKMGAAVILVGRSTEKCAATQEMVIRETGSTQVNFLVADLSSMKQVRGLAQSFLAKHNRLDVLVNNAGSFFMHRKVTADGYECTFALNHLSYFLLTLLLLDTLKASRPSRIINVASDSHKGQQINFNDLNSKKSYLSFRAYGRSKLANILFTYELARRLEGTNVTANAVHPGFVATNIWGGLEMPRWIRNLMVGLIKMVALSPEKGAETNVYLAASPEVEGVSGKYFVRKQSVSSDHASYDEKAAHMLWQRSLEMSSLS